MKVKIKILLLFSLLGLFIPAITNAQFKITTFADIGENNVSEGVFLNSSLLGTYEVSQFQFSAGSNLDFISPGNNFYSATLLNISRDFIIKDFDFRIEGIFIHNNFSKLINEYNFGILSGFDRSKLTIRLGTNFRIYYLTKHVTEQNEADIQRNLHENWNLMYRIAYYIKPSISDWNIGLAITNFDHFLINQETNPMFNLNGHYRISERLNLFAESWLQNAGSFNINTEYFGFFIRMGATWNISTRY